MKAYCNELENLAFTLNDLGITITDNRLALQVLHGLSSDHRTFRSLVQHMNPVSSLDTLWSMLESEEHSHNKDMSPSHESALVAPSKPPPLEKSETFEILDTSTYRGGHRHHRHGGWRNRGHQHSPNGHAGPCPKGPPSYSSFRPSRHSFNS